MILLSNFIVLSSREWLGTNSSMIGKNSVVPCRTIGNYVWVCDSEIYIGIELWDSKRHNDTSKENGGTIKETIKEIIVKEIQANSAITMKELAERINLTVAGVRYHLNKMSQAGSLSREGSTKAGKWIIHEWSNAWRL